MVAAKCNSELHCGHVLHQEPPTRAAGTASPAASRATRSGYAVAALNRLAQSDLLDRLGLRKQAEQAVFTVTRGGFRTATTAGRAFARAGQPRAARHPGRRPPRPAASST